MSRKCRVLAIASYLRISVMGEFVLVESERVLLVRDAE